MAFIIHFKDGSRETYSNSYEDSDAAWDDVYMMFPEADYIELF